MTMVDSGITYWPSPIGSMASALNSAGGFNALTFDSTTDKLAYIGRYYGDNDSIASVKFMVGAIAASAGTGVQVRIETVTGGRPSGTLWAANTSASVVIADTDDSTYKTATLTAAASLVAGDEFAIVIIYEAGNDDGTFSVVFNSAPTNFNGSISTPPQFPQCLQDTGGGTWVTVTNPLCWIVTMTTAGVKHFTRLLPIFTAGSSSIVSMANNAANDERALRFQIPFKARAIGIRAFIGNITAGADFQFVLWGSAGDEVGEELASTLLLDGDSAINTTYDGYVDLFFTAPYTLATGTTYYAGVKALATATFALFQIMVESAADLAALPLSSASQIYLSTRTWDEAQTPDLAGAWTNTTTAVPLISLIIDQLDDGAGGGGETIKGNPTAMLGGYLQCG